MGAAQGRARPGDRRRRAGADGHVLLPPAQHRPGHRAPGARQYEAQFGRAPDARALASLRQWANHATRRGKDAEPLDLAALVRRWSAQARASEAGALEPLAPAVMNTGAAASQPAEPGAAPGAGAARTRSR